MTFSGRNKLRCESPAGFNHRISSWSLSDWMTVVAGEVGEAEMSYQEFAEHYIWADTGEPCGVVEKEDVCIPKP